MASMAIAIPPFYAHREVYLILRAFIWSFHCIIIIIIIIIIITNESVLCTLNFKQIAHDQ